MLWKSNLRSAIGINIPLLLMMLFLMWFLIGRKEVWIYGLSFAVHLVNLQAYLWRRVSVNELVTQSIALRIVAWGVIIVLLVPTLPAGMNLWAIRTLLAGTLLHAMSVRALGMRRTYYSVELGQDDPLRIRAFPYTTIPHPKAQCHLL